MDDSKKMLAEYWGPAGLQVIDECAKYEPLCISIDEFLGNYCVACGGNWGGMLLSGIRKVRPEVWEVIPEDMGYMSMGCIVSTTDLLGIYI